MAEPFLRRETLHESRDEDETASGVMVRDAEHDTMLSIMSAKVINFSDFKGLKIGCCSIPE